MRPVSVVAKPTSASSRWIGPVSLAESGARVAVGEAADAAGEGLAAVIVSRIEAVGVGADALEVQVAVTRTNSSQDDLRARFMA
jgi:hypothetical protein